MVSLNALEIMVLMRRDYNSSKGFYPEGADDYANDSRSQNRITAQGMGGAGTGVSKQWNEYSCMVQGKGHQPAYILLTLEDFEERSAETSRHALAANRSA